MFGGEKQKGLTASLPFLFMAGVLSFAAAVQPAIAEETRPKLKILLAPYSSEEVGAIDSLERAFKRRLEIAVKNGLAVSLGFVDDTAVPGQDRQGRVPAALPAVDELQDLISPGFALQLQATEEAEYWILGQFDRFGGEVELLWQLVERPRHLGTGPSNWRIGKIENLMFTPTGGVQEFHDKAAAMVEAIARQVPELRKPTEGDRELLLKVSCFVGGKEIKELMRQHGTEFEKQRAKLLGDLMPVLPSMLAIELVDGHNFKKYGMIVEPTPAVEVSEKCMDDRPLTYWGGLLSHVDYLLYGYISAVNREQIGFIPHVDSRSRLPGRLFGRFEDKAVEVLDDQQAIVRELAGHIAAEWENRLGLGR